MAHVSFCNRARRPRRTLRLLTLAFLCCGSASWLLASDQEVTNELNTGSVHPAVDHLSDGSTVYAWQGGLTGQSGRIIARRFDSVGSPLEDPFVVGVPGLPGRRPDVQGNGSGGFVVVWKVGTEDGFGVRGRAFGSDGSPTTGEFEVSDTALGAYSLRPELAVHDDGSFVVVWEAQGFDGSNPGIAGRRFDPSGVALGPEFVVNNVTAGSQLDPSIAMDADGDFLVTWHDAGVRGRLFSADGTPQTDDLVLADIPESLNGSGVAMMPDGRFAIAYTVDPLGDLDHIVALRRFDASGAPLEGALLLSADLSSQKLEPSVAVHTDGTYHAIWQDRAQGFDWNVLGRTVLPGGTLDGSEAFPVHQTVAGNQVEPDVTVHGSGEAIYTWEGSQKIYTNCDGLGPCTVFSDGFESGSVAAWSSASPP